MDFFSDLCRACNIKKEKLLNIHDVEESSKFIKNMLEYCLQTILMEESKYPKFICFDCLKQLEISYRFIKRFHLSMREFEESYNSLQKYGEVDNRISETFVEIHSDEVLRSSVETFKDSNIINKAPNLSPTNSIPIKNSLKCHYMPECPADVGKSAEICPLCNKTFFTKKALNLHEKLSHKQKFSSI